MVAEEWLKNYVERNGDKMPDRDCVNLPSSITINSLFEEYSQSFEATISRATFYRIWLLNFAERVKIPPVSKIMLFYSDLAYKK